MKQLLTEAEALRLRELLDIIQREVMILKRTDEAIPQDISDEWILSIETNMDRSNLIDAFAARHSRLQDTLGDKLLPLLLQFSQESTGTAIDNINRAERLGWINAAENWRDWRVLRNQLVHEYFSDKRKLKGSLHKARLCLQELFFSADSMTQAGKKLLDVA